MRSNLTIPRRLFPTTLLALILSTAASPAIAADAPSLASRPDAFFTTDEGRRTLDNILSWQGHGPGNAMGWPKAYDVSKPRPQTGASTEWQGIATIDNGATYTELRLLARAISAESPGDRRDKITAAFNAGLDALLAAQYDNGGFPQRFPVSNVREPYAKHITFNDNAMIRVLTELQAIAAGQAPYAFVDEPRRAKAKTAVDKGIACILNCQITLDNKLTAWCAQHDEITLKPAGARTYEHPSTSGSEGAAVAIFLMKIDQPDDRTKKAIHAAAAWFQAARIAGKKVQSVSTTDGSDRILVDDPASTLWARFYDLGSYPGAPIFSGRDGIIKKSLDQIERERRTGYSWYGTWGRDVESAFAAWKKRLGE